MATKTFKIGEYAKGGVITAEATKTKVTVICKDWDFSTGSRRSSSQKNAKELTRMEVKLKGDSEARRKIERFLLDITTSYYTDKILEWIETKTKFETSLRW